MEFCVEVGEGGGGAGKCCGGFTLVVMLGVWHEVLMVLMLTQCHDLSRARVLCRMICLYDAQVCE